MLTYSFCPIKIELTTSTWVVTAVDGQRVDLAREGMGTTLDALRRDPYSDMDLDRLRKKTEKILSRDIRNCRVALAEALRNVEKAKGLFEVARCGG